MPEMIISASGPQYGLVINEDGSINANVSGINVDIGSLILNLEDVYIASGNNITGSFFQMEGVPTSSIYLNPEVSLVYSGTALGSIYSISSAGSYLKVLSYDVSGNLIKASSWEEI